MAKKGKIKETEPAEATAAAATVPAGAEGAPAADPVSVLPPAADASPVAEAPVAAAPAEAPIAPASARKKGKGAKTGAPTASPGDAAAGAASATVVLGEAPGDRPPAPPAPGADEDDEDAIDPALPIPVGDEARGVLEAILFSATQPLTESRLSRLMNGIDIATLHALLLELQAQYAQVGRGIALVEVAGGWQLATRPNLADWVYRLHRHRKRSPLTPAVLETLAIIAYKQPIVRTDIEAIRGVDCGGMLRQLMDMGLIEIVGRREVIGRPPLYGSTELFLKTFGLKRLSDLPALHDLQALLQPPEAPLPGQGDLFTVEGQRAAVEAGATGLVPPAQDPPQDPAS